MKEKKKRCVYCGHTINSVFHSILHRIKTRKMNKFINKMKRDKSDG